jgi:hypothetical protein
MTTLKEIFNYLTTVKGWDKLSLTGNEMFLKGESITFKALQDESVIVEINDKQVQRYKGTKEHITSRIHDFIEGFYFYN